MTLASITIALGFLYAVFQLVPVTVDAIKKFASVAAYVKVIVAQHETMWAHFVEQNPVEASKVMAAGMGD